MFFYSIFSRIVYLFLLVLSFFSSRIRQLYVGRKNQEIFPLNDGQNIWFHCASYGEYEGIAPLIKHYHHQNHSTTILSFFSPSGYNHTLKKNIADVLCYSPWDTRRSVRSFLDRIKPKALVISQNDYWPIMISECHNRGISVYYIATYINEGHWWTSSIYSSITRPLKQVKAIFLQDKKSFELLQNAGFDNISVSGNPRIQQVIGNKGDKKAYPFIESFIEEKPCLIFGSTLESDHKMIAQVISDLSNYKLIIVPHEIDDKHLLETMHHLPQSIKLSALNKNSDHGQEILIVDTIGDLKYLYQYADIAYVGGGFDKGTHSTLEPAIFRIPVISGPNIDKYVDTRYLHKIGLVRLINDHSELLSALDFAKGGLTDETVYAFELFIKENSVDLNKIIREIDVRMTDC